MQNSTQQKIANASEVTRSLKGDALYLRLFLLIFSLEKVFQCINSSDVPRIIIAKVQKKAYTLGFADDQTVKDTDHKQR